MNSVLVGEKCANLLLVDENHGKVLPVSIDTLPDNSERMFSSLT